MKKVLKTVLGIILAVVLAALCYLIYVLTDYHRIEDHLALEIISEGGGEAAEAGEEYQIVSWNIGFGAYEPDYGFFMDGGTESWAWSEERLNANLDKIYGLLREMDADIYLVEEVDTDSTRSYHVDERAGLVDALKDWDSKVFARNYDSPFLFYPFTQPHGSSRSGILTVADFRIDSSLRRQLPIETGFTKFLDLDRCYSVSRISVDNGKELVLYTLHLSAYSSDGTIATDQLEMLLSDMQGEYEKGNYAIAGGDFNKDLLGDSTAVFGVPAGELTWAQPVPFELFDGLNVSLVAPLDEADPVPTCRNADGPYNPNQFVVTVDGFVVSDNVEVSCAKVIDTGFAYSDHNPVEMLFTLCE